MKTFSLPPTENQIFMIQMREKNQYRVFFTNLLSTNDNKKLSRNTCLGVAFAVRLTKIIRHFIQKAVFEEKILFEMIDCF